MGRTARPLHDPGNNGAIERRSNLQAARRGGLMKPAKPAGERKNTAALTPSLGTRSDAKGKGASSETARPKVPMRRVGADCSVVARKRGNARGAKGAGHRRWE